MKREILTLDRHVTDCCPGHSTYPDDTYNNRRSKKARTRSKQLEHQHVRSIIKRNLRNEVKELDNNESVHRHRD